MCKQGTNAFTLLNARQDCSGIFENIFIPCALQKIYIWHTELPIVHLICINAIFQDSFRDISYWPLYHRSEDRWETRHTVRWRILLDWLTVRGCPMLVKTCLWRRQGTVEILHKCFKSYLRCTKFSTLPDKKSSICNYHRNMSVTNR